jgi:hypothetical protein
MRRALDYDDANVAPGGYDMQARVTQFNVDPRDIDLDIAQGVFEKLVVPEMRKQTGYEGCYLLRTEKGKGMLVTLWEDEAAAMSSEHSGFYGEQIAKLLPLLGPPLPEHELYSVAFADHTIPPE